MSKEMKLIPELRFPEFTNNGDWENKPISKIGETVNGLSGKKGADFGSGSPYVQYKQVFDKSFIDFSECGKVDVGADENQNQLQLGDILFTTSSETPDEVGFASVITNQPEVPTYLNSFCFILRPNDLQENVPGFSRYLFHSPNYRKSVSAIAQGSTRYNLSKGSFSKLRVPIPKSEEQQKIASCLSSLDELIGAHNDKLDALKDHKKGLLQNLFPQEGETVPKVRFPEFEGDGEWVEKSIGSIAKVSAGGTPTSTEQKYWGGDIPWMSSGELNLKRVYSVEKTITELGLQESSTKKIPPLCVLIGLAGQGKTRGTAAINYIELCTNQSIAAIHPSRKKFDSEFLYHKIDSMYKTLRRLSTGQGGRGGLNLSIIREIEISFPSLEEQQKIATCLSAVDELITAQKEIIEELYEHKKGLMQGLFPNPSASSGETIKR